MPTVRPNLGIEAGWVHKENGWHEGMNRNLRLLDSVAQISVLAITNTPPVSPSDGHRYIVDTIPTGAWIGRTGALAVWNAAGSTWDFYTPRNGWRAFIENEASNYIYASGAWQDVDLVQAANWSYRTFDMAKVVTSGAITGYTRRVGTTGAWTDSIDGGTTFKTTPTVAGANKAIEFCLEDHAFDEYIGFGSPWFRYLWKVRARVNPGIGSVGADAGQIHGIGIGSPWRPGGGPYTPPWPNPSPRAFARMYYQMDTGTFTDYKLMCKTSVGDGVRPNKTTQIGVGFSGLQKNAHMEIVWNPYKQRIEFNAYSTDQGNYTVDRFVESDVNELPRFRADADLGEFEKPFILFAETGSNALQKPEVFWGEPHRACKFRVQPATLWYSY